MLFLLFLLCGALYTTLTEHTAAFQVRANNGTARPTSMISIACCAVRRVVKQQRAPVAVKNLSRSTVRAMPPSQLCRARRSTT